MIVAKFVAVVLIGYLLGSIPFGILIGKRSARVDVRKVGSGKTGATNVLRTAGKKAAALVAILDLLKGVLAVRFAGLIFGGDYLAIGSSGLWGQVRGHWRLWLPWLDMLGRSSLSLKGGEVLPPFWADCWFYTGRQRYLVGLF